MRLVTYDPGDGPRAGILDGDRVSAVAGDAPPASVDDLLRAGPLDDVEPAGQGVLLAEVTLLAPVQRPSKIVCIGLNYGAHAAEAGIDPPEFPTFFAKFANALAAPGAAVPLPSYSEKVDYEAEVAFVIGETAREVAEGDALSVIAGYTLLNDLSARDYQFKTPQWMPGKVFDQSAPCGPALVTPDEAGPHDAIEIALDRNGERLQESSTADLIHSIPALVAQLSMLMTLEPGDLVATGTPAGVGGAREPHIWLEPGDEVVVSSPQLGRLETRIG